MPKESLDSTDEQVREIITHRELGDNKNRH
jgi:hypothetical protein